MPRFSLAAIPVIALLLSSCAQPQTSRATIDPALVEAEAEKQRELVISRQLRDQSTLSNINYRLRAAGTEICGKRTVNRVGVNLANLQLYPEEWRSAVKTNVPALDDRLQVLRVAPGSAAADTGLTTGDVLIWLDDQNVPRGEKAAKKFQEVFGEKVSGGKPFELTVARGETIKKLTLTSRTICEGDPDLINDSKVNAFADGKRIAVTSGMMRFVESENELAFVVAHELAHNAMGHIVAKRTNALGGALLGLLVDIAAAAGGVNTGGQYADLGSRAGAGAWSQDFEAEADYVGLYILARAGYDIKLAPNFWRRMATMDPGAIVTAKTHPTTPQRFVAMENAIKEIEGKRARGAELVPELKKGSEEDSGPS